LMALGWCRGRFIFFIIIVRRALVVILFFVFLRPQRLARVRQLFAATTGKESTNVRLQQS
jgi:hypothetical protein